jgi:hypothetical protein
MIRCKNCGWENSNENAPCEKCGAKLTASDNSTVAPSPAQRGNTQKTALGCPQCGYPVRPTDERCPNCDAPVERRATQTGNASAQPAAAYKQTVIGRPPAVDGNPVEGRRLVGVLVSYSIRPQGDFFPVAEGKNYIGRETAANICVAGDPQMSERHLSILYRSVDNKFKFKDEQSSNGTFVNDVLSDEGELKSGDVIRAGSTKFLFFAIPNF